MKNYKRFLRKTVWWGLAAIALVVSLNFVLRAVVVHSLKNALIEKGIAFTVQSVRIDYLPLKIYLEKTELSALPVFDRSRIAIGSMVAHVSFKDLMKGRLRIIRLEVADPDIRAYIDRQGDGMLPNLLADNQPQSEGGSVSIDIVQIQQGKLQLHFENANDLIQLTEVAVSYEKINPKYGMVSIKSGSSGIVRINQQSFSLADLMVNGRLDETGFQMRNGSFLLNQSKFDFNGAVNWVGRPELLATIRTRISDQWLQPWQTLLTEEANQIISENKSIEMSARVRIDPYTLILDPLTIGSKTIHLSASLLWNYSHPFCPLFIKSNWQELNLSQFAKITPLKIDSISSGALNLEIPVFPDSKMRGFLHAQFTPLKNTAPTKQTLALAGTIDLGFDAHAITISNLAFSVAGSELAGHVTVKNNALSGELRLNTKNIQGLADLAENFTTDFKEPMKRIKTVQGALDISAQISGTTANPLISFQLHQLKASLMNDAVFKLSGQGRLKNKRLELDELIFQQRSLTGRLSGGFALTPDLGKLKLLFTLQGKNIDLQKSPLWDMPKTPIDGSFNTRMTIEKDQGLSLTVANIRLMGSLDLEKTQWDTWQIGDISSVISTNAHSFVLHSLVPVLGCDIKTTIPKSNPWQITSQLAVDHCFQNDRINQLVFFIKENIECMTTGKIKLTMDLRDPAASFSLTAKIDKLQLVTGQNVLLSARQPFSLGLDAQGFSIEKLMMEAPALSLEVDGGLNFHTQSSRFITIKAIGELHPLNALLQNMVFTGNLESDIQIKGRLDKMRIFSHIYLKGGSIDVLSPSIAIDQIDLRLRVIDNMVTMPNLQFHLGDGYVEGKAAWPLKLIPFFLRWTETNHHVTGLEPSFIELKSTPISLASIKFKTGLESISYLSGKAAIDCQLKFKQPDLSDLAGFLKVDTDQIQVNGIPFSCKEPIVLNFSKKEWRLQPMNCLLFDDSSLKIRGKIDFTAANPDLDVQLSADLNASVWNFINPSWQFSGRQTIELTARHDLFDPVIIGKLVLQNNSASFPQWGVFLKDVQGDITYANYEITTEKINGIINNGPFTMQGKLDYTNSYWQSKGIDFSFQDAKMEVVEGFFTNASGTLNWSMGKSGQLIAGAVTLFDAFYRQDIRMGSFLYQYFLKSSSGIADDDSRNTLPPITFDIGIQSKNPIQIANNLANVSLSSDLRIKGTLKGPLLSGRLSLQRGGEILFGNRVFKVDKGDINFLNPYKIEPEMDISASVQVNEYAIQLKINGVPRELKVYLTSRPALSETNIISLLSTGKTLQEFDGSAQFNPQNLALNYLGSTLTEGVERWVKRNMPLQQFRIDGTLISATEDPKARITMGKKINDQLDVVYSQGILEELSSIWIVNYLPLPRVNLQVIRHSDDRFTLKSQYKINFGIQADAAQKNKKKKKLPIDRISAVTFSGNLGIITRQAEKLMQRKIGKKYNYFMHYANMEALRKLYRQADYLYCRIEGNVEKIGNQVKLHYSIDCGPQIRLVFRGDKPAGKIIVPLQNIFSSGQFAEKSIDQAITFLKEYYIKKRFLKVQIDFEEKIITDSSHYYYFQINKGRKYHLPKFQLVNQAKANQAILDNFLKNKNLRFLAITNAKQFETDFNRYLAANGYLKAKANLISVQYQKPDDKPLITVKITDGNAFRVSTMIFSGNTFFSDSELKQLTSPFKHQIYSADLAEEIGIKLKTHYRSHGFENMHLSIQKKDWQETGVLTLEITIHEEKRSIIRSIRVQGNKLVKPRFTLRLLPFKIGDYLKQADLYNAKKRLYNLGIFELIDLQVSPYQPDSESLKIPNVEKDHLTSEVQIVLTVKESKPQLIKLGLQYDSETLLGVGIEAENNNICGLAQVLGGSFRINQKEKDFRGYFSIPSFIHLNMQAIASIYFNETETAVFTLKKSGVSVQNQWNISRQSLASLGYALENSRYIRSGSNINPDDEKMISHLTLAFSQDTRNNIFHPVSGMFFSQSIQYAPRLFGTKDSFMRFFLQWNSFRPLMKIITSATAVRFGLGFGFGGDLIASEKYYATGASTIRGYAVEEVGPRDPLQNQVIGGNVLLILRQEFRLPVWKFISGVVFFDMGNVYDNLNAFKPFDLRTSVGIGARFYFHPLLLRIDAARKLEQNNGLESNSMIYFSIGHLF